jgi:hypothetical protein
MPFCVITFIASRIAMDSPSTMEHIPSFHMVPAKTMRKFIYIVSEEIHLWINIMRGN